MIEFKDVCYAYEGEPVLRYVNFSIPSGATVLLQGPNGCGKSTLLKMLNGLIFPHEGSYTFEKKQIDEKAMKNTQFAKWYHQRIGFVWQNPDVQLFCNNVEEEIAFGPKQMGLTDHEVRQRVDEAIELLSLEKLRCRAPYHLSGGEKKKVAIASILVMNPEVWTMDEPLSALDEKTQLWLLDFLKALKAAGKTLIISTHDKMLARDIADFRICMDEEHQARVEAV